MNLEWLRANITIASCFQRRKIGLIRDQCEMHNFFARLDKLIYI